MDACTSYGTGWFEPFSHARVSFNTLFILDPFFMLPILVGSIILLILKSTSDKRLKISKLALSISFIYLAITVMIKLYVNNTIAKDLAAQKIPHTDFMVTPTPLNNLLWYVVTKDSGDCRVSYYSVFDKKSDLDYYAIPKNDSLLTPYKSSGEVQKLLVFSKYYYSVNKTDSSILFNDLRFGQIGGWYDPDAPCVFSFDITRRNNAAHIQQGRMKAIDSKPLTELVKRIKGKD
jgi:inner membrane protein